MVTSFTHTDYRLASYRFFRLQSWVSVSLSLVSKCSYKQATFLSKVLVNVDETMRPSLGYEQPSR